MKTAQSSNAQIFTDYFRWFEKIGSKYIGNILSIVDFEKMKKDNDYAKQIFLFYWAYERQGAPGGYKIAAIKSISSCKNVALKKEFYKYYKGKPNISNNPILDKRFLELDIKKIIKCVNNCEFEKAFDALKLNGLGHKIRSFFLRDIAFLAKIDEKSLVLKDYLYLCPVDIWIRLTIDTMNIEDNETNINKSNYHFSSTKDFNIAIRLIFTCLQNKVSPILVNMGIWYFCSRCIGNSERLIELIQNNNIKVLENELLLMNGFDDYKISFIN